MTTDAQPKKRKPSKTRPTARTLKLLRDQGHTAQVVERWQMIPGHPGGGVRQDLFGCIDVVAMMPSRVFSNAWDIVGIQCGAGSGHSGHKAKCLAEPRMIEWLRAGARLLLHSWALQGAKDKAKRWTLREEELTLADFTTKQEELF